jgi:plasmid stabilization system protein ParE
MSESEIRAYAQGRRFHDQTLARWLGWERTDRDALGELASGLKIGENHLRDMMDWLEDTASRDHAKISQILATKAISDLSTDPRLGRADKVKRIKEHLRRLRFPRLAQTEDEIRTRIQSLKLHPEIRVSVPPGLEGGRLHVEFTATSTTELLTIAGKLRAAAETSLAPEIFDVLAGTHREKERE